MKTILRHALRIATLAAFIATTPASATDALNHAINPLVTPTVDGSGQVVEPDVVYIPQGWHGYEYWMAVTPYPCGDETQENPYILASHDGVSWDRPTVGGFTAPWPLVPQLSFCPGNYTQIYAVNNDPSIVIVGDTLSIYYFATYGRGGGTTYAHRIASADGVHWTDGATAPTLWSKTNYPLSPSVTYDNGLYCMFYAYTGSCGGLTEVHRRTSTDGLTWPDAADSVVTVNNLQGRYVWHLSAKNIGGVYCMLYVSFLASSQTCGGEELYYAESTDKGHNWTALTQPMLTKSTDGWDNGEIYRSGFVGRYPNMGVWYSAVKNDVCYWCPNGGNFQGSTWHAGYTSIGDYSPPAPISLSAGGGCYDHIFLSWYAPGDDWMTGTATAYDLRWSTSPITDANFGGANGISTGTPQTAGSLEELTVGVPRCSSIRYYAIKARDEANNWSALSNVLFAKPACPHPPIQCWDARAGLAPPDVAPDLPTTVELSAPVPNPVASDGLRLQFGVPANLAGAEYDLSVFDLAGRRVAIVDRGQATVRYHAVTWNLRSQDGSRVARGMYYLRLRVGPTTLTQRFISVR